MAVDFRGIWNSIWISRGECLVEVSFAVEVWSRSCLKLYYSETSVIICDSSCRWTEPCMRDGLPTTMRWLFRPLLPPPVILRRLMSWFGLAWSLARRVKVERWTSICGIVSSLTRPIEAPWVASLLSVAALGSSWRFLANKGSAPWPLKSRDRAVDYGILVSSPPYLTLYWKILDVEMIGSMWWYSNLDWNVSEASSQLFINLQLIMQCLLENTNKSCISAWARLMRATNRIMSKCQSTFARRGWNAFLVTAWRLDHMKITVHTEAEVLADFRLLFVVLWKGNNLETTGVLCSL